MKKIFSIFAFIPLFTVLAYDWEILQSTDLTKMDQHSLGVSWKTHGPTFEVIGRRQADNGWVYSNASLMAKDPRDGKLIFIFGSLDSYARRAKYNEFSEEAKRSNVLSNESLEELRQSVVRKTNELDWPYQEIQVKYIGELDTWIISDHFSRKRFSQKGVLSRYSVIGINKTKNCLIPFITFAATELPENALKTLGKAGQFLEPQMPLSYEELVAKYEDDSDLPIFRLKLYDFRGLLKKLHSYSCYDFEENAKRYEVIRAADLL